LNSSWGTSISIVYDQASFDEYFQEDRRAIDREPLSAFGLFENADIFAEMGRETSRAFPYGLVEVRAAALRNPNRRTDADRRTRGSVRV
jgi:hypothetical protein